MVSDLKASIAKKLFLGTLKKISEGYLELVCPDETYRFGNSGDPLRATIAVHDERFFVRALLNGDVGVGESYMAGEWSTPDLVSVARLGVRNLDHLEARSRLTGIFHRTADFISHRSNRNTIAGSKRNIAYHYDLGNDFYRLFLDQSMAYSCAYYDGPDDTLEEAQQQKFDVICRKLRLSPQDRLLEIGSGWGGFAAFAAANYGCHITTTTISKQQHDYARELFDRLGLSDRIDLLLEDYRNLQGQFDKIVSIEMFEAVGFEHYDDYFRACDRLLKPDGSMLLQTISIRETKFERYRRESDWIRKHIFPGGELASVTEIMRSLTRTTQIQAFHLEDIGIHYALTLREWRRRFFDNLSSVRSMNFDESFIRKWDYYLATCEGMFLERAVSDVQLLLSKVTNHNQLLNEPIAVREREEVSQ